MQKANIIMNVETLYTQHTSLRSRALELASVCKNNDDLIDQYNDCMSLVAELERWTTGMQQMEQAPAS